VKITVERCDKIKVAVSQIFDRVKSIALWSANIRTTVPQLIWKAINKYVTKRIIHMTPLSQSVLLSKLLLKGATKSLNSEGEQFYQYQQNILSPVNTKKDHEIWQ
jgi:hypothetical protein